MGAMQLVCIIFRRIKGKPIEHHKLDVLDCRNCAFRYSTASQKSSIGWQFVLAVLIYAYTLVYKAGGLQGVRMVASGADMDYLKSKTGRSLQGTLLGDIGRADMQAVILRQVCDPHFEYTLAMGRTYFATLCRFIPRTIWRDRPDLKSAKGQKFIWEGDI